MDPDSRTPLSTLHHKEAQRHTAMSEVSALLLSTHVLPSSLMEQSCRESGPHNIAFNFQQTDSVLYFSVCLV